MGVITMKLLISCLFILLAIIHGGLSIRCYVGEGDDYELYDAQTGVVKEGLERVKEVLKEAKDVVKTKLTKLREDAKVAMEDVKEESGDVQEESEDEGSEDRKKRDVEEEYEED